MEEKIYYREYKKKDGSIGIAKHKYKVKGYRPLRKPNKKKIESYLRTLNEEQCSKIVEFIEKEII